MKDRKYFDDCMCNYVDVCDGDKPLMIVSEGKSTLAYETIAMLAERSNMRLRFAMLRCEDGELHEHAFVSSRSFDSDVDYTLAAIKLISRAKLGEVSRSELQFYLGRMLGYTMTDTLDFIASKVARDCPCDCCGGPFVSEEITG